MNNKELKMSDLNFDKNKVIVFTKPACTQCDDTKAALNERNVEFEIINILDDPSTLKALKAAGFKSAPVVFYNGDSWSGFKEDKIKEHFGA